MTNQNESSNVNSGLLTTTELLLEVAKTNEEKISDLKATIASLNEKYDKDVDVSDWSQESKDEILAVQRDYAGALHEFLRVQRHTYEQYAAKLRDCVERSEAIQTKETRG